MEALLLPSRNVDLALDFETAIRLQATEADPASGGWVPPAMPAGSPVLTPPAPSARCRSSPAPIAQDAHGNALVDAGAVNTRAMSSMPVTTSLSSATITSPGSRPPACRAAGQHLDHAHARRLREPCPDLDPLRQGYLVAGHAERARGVRGSCCSTWVSTCCAVGGHREADALRAHDHGGVDADHLGARVDERPARVARG